MDNAFSYEVETRLVFESRDEAFKLLPFLKDSLKNEVSWKTEMYGHDLFRSDRILRSACICSNKVNRFFIGFKEKDTGTFCNIRAERDEEITDGLQDSIVLRKISGEKILLTPDNVADVFKSTGHEQLMSFTGFNLTGEYDGFALKLLSCAILEYPIMLEIEKQAPTIIETENAEKEVYDFIAKYKLLDRVMKKEPTTLLYEKVFSR